MIETPEATYSNPWPVWGHEQAVKELTAAAVRGPRHAYILSGYDGLGKSTIATTFAQALLCQQPPSPGVPCLECPACRRISRGTHPDCSLWNLERQQASADKGSASVNLTLNIQTVRDITSTLSRRPLESRYRVVIVDDVETMQETAQEAFLKTLEEPPAYAVILLLTTDAESLLETIRSRAMTIQLQSVPTDRIELGLRAQGVPSDDAKTIAEASGGSPGWAIRAAGDPALLSDRLAQRDAARTWIDGDRYLQLVEATKLGEVWRKERSQVQLRLQAVQAVWRSRTIESLQNDDARTTMLTVRALKSVETCLADLDANVRPILALQNMVLQWPTRNR